jgi:hypothetical protein
MNKCKDPIWPFRSRSAYFYGRRFNFVASLGWWRWKEFGFTLKLDHDRSLLKAFNTPWKHHDVLWWQFLWINGHFSWDYGRTRPAERVGWVFHTWGHAMKKKDLTRPA